MAFGGAGVFDLPAQVSPNAAAGIAQYAAVVLDTAGGSGPYDCVYPGATGGPAIGINQSPGGPPTPGGTIAPASTSGQTIDVRVLGVSKAIAAGAIAAGAYVQVSGTTGQLASVNLQPATTPTDSFVVGVALTPATAAGDLFSVLLLPGLATQVTA